MFSVRDAPFALFYANMAQWKTRRMLMRFWGGLELRDSTKQIKIIPIMGSNPIISTKQAN